MIRKTTLLICFLLLSFAINAQNMSVESFRLLENDLTANTYGTIERDQNGDKAALIKIITTETGFVFDGGMMGIVKTEQKVSEVWVYVPHSIQKIKIMHQRQGQIEYYFPIHIESARTYELVLKTASLQNVSSTTYIDVSFENPMKSDIYLNGIKTATGSWKGSILATSYMLEVKRDRYIPYSTTLTLTPSDNGKVITIPELEPMKGSLYVISQPVGATVFLDGVDVGITPLKKEEINPGRHTLELRKDNYRSVTKTVEILGGEQTPISVGLLEIFTLTVNTQPSGASFSLNGEYKGTTPYQGEMTSGYYDVRLSLSGYSTFYKTVHLDSSNKDLSITLESSQPSRGKTAAKTKTKTRVKRSNAITNGDNLYLGAAYEVGHLKSIYAYGGGYFGKGNLEVGYLMPKDAPVMRENNLMYDFGLISGIAAHTGIDISLGKKARVTPRIGMLLEKVNSVDGDKGKLKDGYYILNGRMSARLAYTPFRRSGIGIVCTPAYDFPVWQEVKDLSSSETFKKWSNGFCVNVGLEFIIR